jgi:MerR family transcriptional regulator/heat shock protein HspR
MARNPEPAPPVAARRKQPKGERLSEGQSAGGKGYYMISVVAEKYGIHPQTLRLYEREGLLKPSRTDGNTRLYSEEDLGQLEVILNLTRDLGVNLAGVEIILNMRRKMEQMQTETNEFMKWVREELMRTNQEGWQERYEQALVKLPTTHIVRSSSEG